MTLSRLAGKCLLALAAKTTMRVRTKLRTKGAGVSTKGASALRTKGASALRTKAVASFVTVDVVKTRFVAVKDLMTANVPLWRPSRCGLSNVERNSWRNPEISRRIHAIGSLQRTMRKDICSSHNCDETRKVA